MNYLIIIFNSNVLCEQWQQSLLSPGRKSSTVPQRHVYAIEYPEPLVHFALSLGAFSDPVVCEYYKTTLNYM